MKFTPIKIAALVLLAAHSAASSAEPFAPAQFRCSAVSGGFSELISPWATAMSVFTGQITAVSYRENKDWRPSAKILLERPDYNSSISIVVERNLEKPDELYVGLSANQDGELKTTLIKKIALQDKVPFSIGLEPDGEVTVGLAGDTYTFPAVSTEKASLSVVCSTGDFLFDELKWHATPPELSRGTDEQDP